MKYQSINPDHYLETDSGRIWSAEKNKDAWTKAYQDFEQSLQSSEQAIDVYVVFGVQGSGKSTWITTQKKLIKNPSIFFDAAMPRKIHRQKVIQIAQKYAKNIIAVFINVTINTALKQNRKRSIDKVVPEAAIKSVYQKIEPPSIDEGFTELKIISETI